jgi:hypothetical protein
MSALYSQGSGQESNEMRCMAKTSEHAGQLRDSALLCWDKCARTCDLLRVIRSSIRTSRLADALRISTNFSFILPMASSSFCERVGLWAAASTTA